MRGWFRNEKRGAGCWAGRGRVRARAECACKLGCSGVQRGQQRHLDDGLGLLYDARGEGPQSAIRESRALWRGGLQVCMGGIGAARKRERGRERGDKLMAAIKMMARFPSRHRARASVMRSTATRHNNAQGTVAINHWHLLRCELSE